MSEPVQWTSLQREMLDALGHTVFRIGTDDSNAQPASMPEAGSDSKSNRLLGALVRAAGRAMDDADTLSRHWPMAQLYGNAQAKRALWPQLRAMRSASKPDART